MSYEQDYDLAVCKIPRKDKDGNDISSDKIGKGGRRRDDGTYSGVAYDIELADSYSSPNDFELYPSDPTALPVETDNYDLLQESCDVIGDVATDVLTNVGNILLMKAGDKVEEKVKTFFNKHFRKKAAQRNQNKIKESTPNIKSQKNECKPKNSSEKELYTSATDTAPIAFKFDSVYVQYSEDMTSEQAQKELLDAFIFYILYCYKILKVSHARIIDASGNITSGREIVDRISGPAVIADINSILLNRPDLLEQWQDEALTNILGRKLREEKQYVPLKENELKEKLLGQTTFET